MASTASSSSVFSAFDKDGDGKVSAAELGDCMAAALGEDVSEEEAAAILAMADTDGDGLLDHDEFLGLFGQPEEEEMRIRCLREAFDVYAAEETTVITPASLRRTLRRLGSQHQQLRVEDCRAMICRFDLDGDGVLSFDEFRVMMLMA
ncbi:probable calcium-binding protein CML25/26 [Oryza brachyantha]|uniref:EF-hand domain-containing protein n=1 Tax=Oryza brachyantha TaxID=4533 RepID=J3NAM4_ORYBR|nr:probable calcium-binding protein CML25/26 [Oryza brachyantha]